MEHKPLHGIVVCDFGLHGAGSTCGKVLADWGADVIKVEPLWGCPSRGAGAMLGLSVEEDNNPHTELVNSGKRSISVDMKSPAGREILDRLVAKSHIFFSNYRLKTLEKFGLDYETLSAKYPRLIWGHLNGYGPEGPLKEAPGFDSASYWSYGGLFLAPEDQYASLGRAPFGGGDVMAGMSLASGLAACLYQQAVTGRGQCVYTSLYANGCWQNSCTIQADAAHPGQPPEQRSNALSCFYRCGDGTWFTVTTMDYAKQGPLYAEMIGRPELADTLANLDAIMPRNAELTGLIQDFFLQHTWPEADALLNARDLVHCKVQRPYEVASDPQALENGYVYPVTLRSGETTMVVSTPVQFGRRREVNHKMAPRVGEHTRQVLDELGYSPEEVEQMLARGWIRQAGEPR